MENKQKEKGQCCDKECCDIDRYTRYNINVSHLGKHYFSTEKQLYSRANANDLYTVMWHRFSESDGFNVVLVCYVEFGKNIAGGVL